MPDLRSPRLVQRARRQETRMRPADVVWAVCIGLCATVLLLYGWHLHSRVKCESVGAGTTTADTNRPLLVSYSYFEKDPTQRANFEFFLQHGWQAAPGGRQSITWVFVISGEECSPCGGAFSVSTPQSPDTSIGISKASRVVRSIDDPEPADGARDSWSGDENGSFKPVSKDKPGPGQTWVLWRAENVGMDIAAHNTTLEFVKRHGGGLHHYRYYFLLNSSIKGPYFPAYLPPAWHWTHAFLERFMQLPEGDPRWARPPDIQVLPSSSPYRASRFHPPGPPVVRAVGSSLVCLPPADAGGPGPRLESWALAVDEVALELLVARGVLKVRTCKTCTDAEDGIVVGGEYGITATLLEAGYNVATLMTKYARNVDWRDPRHWGCNDMVHPSRHGTYDGIGFHPYETIFVKSSWHVADAYTKRYSQWMMQHREGDAGTDGEWNERMYRYATSPDAQLPNLLEAAYNVERVRETLAKQRDAEARAVAEGQKTAGERAMALKNA